MSLILAPMISLDQHTRIDESELDFRTSRSSGPGGQHANKTETRVTALFDVEASPNLTDEQKARIRDRLSSRLTTEGVLQVSAESERSQRANREQAVDRLVELLQDALEVPKKRRPTRVPRKAKRRRLENKRRRGQKKQRRGAIDLDDHR